MRTFKCFGVGNIPTHLLRPNTYAKSCRQGDNSGTLCALRSTCVILNTVIKCYSCSLPSELLSQLFTAHKFDVCVTVRHWYNNINNKLDATIMAFINNPNQLNMFRAMISPILRSTRLCLQACDIMHRRCWLLVTRMRWSQEGSIIGAL